MIEVVVNNLNIEGKYIFIVRKEHYDNGIVKSDKDDDFKYKMSNGFTRKKYLFPGELCYFDHKMILIHRFHLNFYPEFSFW